MTTSRGRRSETVSDGESPPEAPGDATPTLNAYEVNAERTVVTESGNTDGWIATDLTVEPRL